MSMNKFMHPRNIYRQPPDFQDLVRQYPELNEVVTVDLNGRLKLDYKNKTALQLLSRCLLKRDFGIDIEIPPDKLIPTLPLRLNYVLWLEDFETAFRLKLDKKELRGLDIGCGASCIYPLLCVSRSKHCWKMVGLEQAVDSVRYARANVERNGLTGCIEIVQQNRNESTVLRDFFESRSNDKFDFCMCNPPFYDDDGMERQNRTGRRKEASNASSGSREELHVEGGEVGFVKKIIEESLELKEHVNIYTSMIGHKRNFEEILRILKGHCITNVTTTRFCQGNTTRWGVAWSFSKTFILSQVPDQFEQKTISKKLLGKPLEGRILTVNETVSMEDAQSRLMQVLSTLDLQIQPLDGSGVDTWVLIALENTWSHQRRRRREGQRKLSPGSENHHNKRREEKESTCGTPSKRPKTDNCNTEPVVRAAFRLIQKPNDGYYFTLSYLGGSAGKDALNQILQYVKNALKKVDQ
ncbi:U6 small nuclear RNA (adenine-(43)-N(6))-methyltransferase [Topomyia yanbarensis]|uniref:U6 small nuclear RNA (adenine-(43)-N(6))-methyltransferase n=1 Tax=Topomyia yanbarensis TaxID=2498891 RepID=UPI00273B6E8D|nr:U6 small nuclear RNA (adenine-(43)-N(6))-methyltransferase [Topomyia yanbarensis]